VVTFRYELVRPPREVHFAKDESGVKRIGVEADSIFICMQCFPVSQEGCLLHVQRSSIKSMK